MSKTFVGMYVKVFPKSKWFDVLKDEKQIKDRYFATCQDIMQSIVRHVDGVQSCEIEIVEMEKPNVQETRREEEGKETIQQNTETSPSGKA